MSAPHEAGGAVGPAARLAAATEAGPQAGGRRLDPAVAQAAAQWFAALRAGDADPQEHSRWRNWHDAHPDHARAWQHLQVVTGALPGLNPGGAAYQGLAAAPRARRRGLLGIAAALGVVAGTGWVASRSPFGQQLAADYASPVGTQRRFTLPDGSELLLGTGGRATLQFGPNERAVRLLAGEALFQTGHPPGALGQLPFVVHTAQGRVRAIGTRFSVLAAGEESRVAVLEGVVELTPATGAPLRLQAGQAATMRADATSTPAADVERGTAWSRGLLIADGQRLDDFLAELGRYRHGWLQADPAVAGLRLSGVFPLGAPADTDAVLALLPNSLPVRVQRRTRWWVLVEPAGR